MAHDRIPSAAFADTKPHYDILDGLRGIAALVVVCFHLFEAFATSHLDQVINHGYLAVDFFFLLSGFVVGYAYDGRWKTMTTGRFLVRRLIRLQPMVVLGAAIGAALFYLQGCDVWDVSAVTVGALVLAALLNALLIPMPPGAEIRGLWEMFPLNGPTWSLFFEYIGNILYALVIRRFSTRVLTLWVAAAGCSLAGFALFGPYGDICAGFTLTGTEFTAGSLRLLFSFSAGLLISRIFRPVAVKGAFWICTLAIVALLSVPRIGGAEHFWMNGLYETFCFALFFPLILWLGASGKTTDKYTSGLCKFLGDISYPLYIVHYPFIYWCYAWVKNGNLTFARSLPGAAALVVGCVVLAYVALKFYDEPLRRYLTGRFLRREKHSGK
ncbi:MAG: acyltransferase [Rikenellaceae bacterium]|nr:acyltransferase [Rikenellaceae bacterium]